MKKIEKKDIKDNFLNILHTIVILLLIVIMFRAVVCVEDGNNQGNIGFFGGIRYSILNADLCDIYTFIGALLILIIGIVGVYEYAYLNGLFLFVPPAYVKVKDKISVKQAEKMMQIYYEKDIEFIKEYENYRISHMLQAMGINRKQFNKMKYNIIKARVMPEGDIPEIREKMKSYILHKEFIEDLSSLGTHDRKYDDVNYYLNLYLATYNKSICDSISKTMCGYIINVLGKRVNDIDYIVVPQGSNILLGLRIGELLEKNVMIMFNEERIQAKRYWDINYDEHRENKIIVIHDVLVSGKRICESVGKLPKNSFKLLGLFCVSQYMDKSDEAKKELENNKIKKTNVLVEVNEDMLRKIKEEDND